MPHESSEKEKDVKGLELTSFTEMLEKVEPEFDRTPADSIKNLDGKLGNWTQEITDAYGENTEFSQIYHQLPFEAFKGFSFDELCKLRYSTIFTMDKSVDAKFKTEPQYQIIHKIQNSMWRWGLGKGTWNEVVDAYNNIRNFKFGSDADFEIGLDYTTGYNEYGYSEHTRTYLDGVFAFLVYYKKKHVMTLGFSLMENRTLLLQQVQLTQRSGNRFLYKLPENRLEYVISQFKQSFPSYSVYVIDGESLIQKTLGQYQASLKNAQVRLERYRTLSGRAKDSESYRREVQETEQECLEFEAKIAHLKTDQHRLIDFYKNTGRFALGPEQIEVNHLNHLRIQDTQ